MVMGSGKLAEPDGAVGAPQVLRDYLRPDALGAAYQNVARRLYFKRPTKPADECEVKFDLPRSMAENCSQPGGSAPEAFAAALS